MSDNRRSARRKVLARASIASENGALTMDAVVRDLSDDGARVAIESGLPIPDHFLLSIPSRNLSRRCRVVWRQANEIGLRFEDAPAADPDRRIDALEGEVAKLRRELAQVRDVLKARGFLE